MRDHLIIKLQGVMQAWGEHTFEGIRPSANFPTRSALIGLLGACLGIKRSDRESQQALADSFLYAVRHDSRSYQTIKLTDYHTVKDARAEYAGLKSHDTIQTWREYLYDATFTLAIWNTDNAHYSLDAIQAAVQKPVYTPFLGRRSCPLTRPLFEDRVTAVNALEALDLVSQDDGLIYSEEELSLFPGRNHQRHRVRDIPLIRQPRQFASRMINVYGKRKPDVSD